MDKFILELPNFIPGELCDHIIKKFENDNRKQPGFVMFKDNKKVYDKRLKDSDELCITELNDWETEDIEISKYLKAAIEKYYEHLSKNFDYNEIVHVYDSLLFLPLTDLGYTIQKQKKGSVYPWHYDGYHTGNGWFLQVIIYLNTLDYGGETEFLCGTKIKPMRGKIMISPTLWTNLHRGNQVETTYSKYTIVCMLRFSNH
jgi:hypothetical protein